MNDLIKDITDYLDDRDLCRSVDEGIREILSRHEYAEFKLKQCHEGAKEEGVCPHISKAGVGEGCPKGKDGNCINYHTTNHHCGMLPTPDKAVEPLACPHCGKKIGDKK